MKESIEKLSDLVLDKKFYPRESTNWLVISNYANAMKVGDKFPPLSVALFNGQKILYDGWHRYKAYLKNKEQYASCEIKKFSNENDLIIEAIKSNARHGKPYTVEEKVKILQKLKMIKVSDKDIEKIMGINIKVWDKITLKQTVMIGDQEKYLKPSLRVSDKDERADELFGKSDMVHSAYTQERLLQEVISLLENGIIDLENKKIVTQLRKIKKLIGKI